MASFNYFNYFTEIEEYFWRKRGAHLLVSPLDWAIVETWQKAGVPLGAVLKGIDRAFESYSRSRRGASGRPMKSLAYCANAVLDAAAESREAAAGAGPEVIRKRPASETFSREELRAYLRKNAGRLRESAERHRTSCSHLAARFEEIAKKLEELAPLLDSPAPIDLENLERRLTALEDKVSAALISNVSEDLLVGIRREIDRALAPYRRKMTAEQLAQLERQYTQKRLLDHFSLPRLSLFYLS